MEKLFLSIVILSAAGREAYSFGATATEEVNEMDERKLIFSLPEYIETEKGDRMEIIIR